MVVDLGALRILEAILSQGSFAKAAASLNKTQAAISYQVRKLEEQLGVVIFDRNSYRAQLTPAGLLILQEGRQLLHHSERIQSIAHKLKQGWEPYLQIVVDGAVPMEPVMRALKTMVERDAPTRVQLKIEFLHGVQACFESDGAAIMIARDIEDDPFYRVTLLPELAFLLCVSSDHPLAARTAVSSTELREHVKVTIKGSHIRIDNSERLAATDGVRALYLSDFETKKRAILRGLGYGWLPIYLIADELRDGYLQPVDFVNGNRDGYRPKFVTRLNREPGQAEQLLEREMLSNFAAFLGGRGPGAEAAAGPRRQEAFGSAGLSDRRSGTPSSACATATEESAAPHKAARGFNLAPAAP